MPEKEESFKRFSDLLAAEGPVAITIKQRLWAANDDDAVIFPPTYPMTTFKGRVHTVHDGEYSVSVELPPDSSRDKGEKSPNQAPGYNIDRFPDGTSSCEIDSPQSQANRIEPIFSGRFRDLVPQVEIRIGTDGAKVNLLVEAGHRAADAVVRMSSLADKFHMAFLDAKAGNHFTLATIAPTSLVFGVWDSRSTQVKLQRIVKAHIRASNIYERTRSAQFSPAADYVGTGALPEGLNSGKGDENTLSQQGMLHALATRTVGGVMLTGKSELTRMVTLNLAAVRQLRAGTNEGRTRALQSYVLGLALVAATAEPDLSLREGCNLRMRDAEDEVKLVPRRGEAVPISLSRTELEAFAGASAEEFFKMAEIDFGKKDHLDAVFESGVAEAFLERTKEEREKISRLGPITSDTMRRFDGDKDPFKALQDVIKTVLVVLGKAPGRRAEKVRNPEALQPVADALMAISEDPGVPDGARTLAAELGGLAREHDDSHETLRKIQKDLREFRKTRRQ